MSRRLSNLIARRDAEPPPPPSWEGLDKVWTPPEWPGISLYHITKPTDLVTWATFMGHSGARYQHWAIDVGIWHFLTFLDEEGYPHCTIHLKDLEWLFRDHPDDANALMPFAWTGWSPSAQDKDGKAKWWVDSTLYDDVSTIWNRACMFKGKPVVVMAAGHRDKDPLWEGERRLVKMWYDSIVIPGSQPIPWEKKNHAHT